MRFFVLILLIINTYSFSQESEHAGNEFIQPLKEGWFIQDSSRVSVSGAVISTSEFVPEGWFSASVPTTVLAALVADSVYTDIYYGRNLEKIPTEQFNRSWWFRKEFYLSSIRSKKIWIRFNGFVYRANIWLNGRQIATADTTEGVFRRFEFDISDIVKKASKNVLAIEVKPSVRGDLSLGFVDWNPWPPDKNLGIWQSVVLRYSNTVRLRYPSVVTKLNLPDTTQAKLTISVDATNTGYDSVDGKIEAKIGSITVSQNIKLLPGETKKIRFTSERFKKLIINHPRLWWPNNLGKQNLYNLQLIFRINGKVSDKIYTQFGIREVGSYFNNKGYRVFTINGKPILIRGGGWTDDLLLTESPEKVEAKVKYAKTMNLNAIRVEGIWGSDDLYRLCDENGLLMLVGWSCWWEFEGVHTSHQMDLAVKYWKDQILRLRNHPSILVWLYGSDKPPLPDLEKRYVKVLQQYDLTRPYLSSATAKPTEVTVRTGVKMNGPYEWVPPVYWYTDTSHGGAFGFSTEVGPGPEVPPSESVKRMIPPEHLWPIDDVWNFHCGLEGSNFDNLYVYTEAIKNRYGVPKDVNDYCDKSQLINYEGIRAMFEAYGRNKFLATGVIQWMLNSAWPSMIWQLYDYYLLPGGAFFGAKEACEPLHVQYAYDNQSVYVVNSFYRSFDDLKVYVRIFNDNFAKMFDKEISVSVNQNESRIVVKLPEIEGLSRTYFLDLRLFNKKGKQISSNFYWLSTKPDVLEEKNSNWYMTPVKSYADFKSLQDIPKVQLKVHSRFEKRGSNQIAHVIIKNPTKRLAFFVHIDIIKGSEGLSVVPVYWDDNYFSLLPGEEKNINAYFATADLNGKKPVVKVTGWNVK